MTWRPLLTGEIAREAEAAVRAIASALEAGQPEIQGPSYSGGHAGVALFHGYFAAAYGDDRSLGLVETFIERAIDGMAEYAYSLGFFGGISGIAWTCHHLDRLLLGEASPETAEEVDQAIAEGVRISPWTWHYDLVYGLAGIGRYALDHPDRAFAAEVIRQIIQRLGELAVERDGGLTWLTPNARIPAGKGKQYPDGFYNLGLAHGVPGLIAMLGEACGTGLAGDPARHLLEGAVTWLLANRRPDEEGSAFPYYLAPTERASSQPNSRSAWCYGDPGVAAALLGAARAVGNARWEQEAIAIAVKDCARSFEATGVMDAELCHGTAGLGHLYNRMYQATGEETFSRAARGWFERTLSRRTGEGIGGFLNWWPEVGEWKSDPGFLTGSAGIGLALLAAVSPIEPGWDRPMMLSLAPLATD